MNNKIVRFKHGMRTILLDKENIYINKGSINKLRKIKRSPQSI